MEEKNQQLTANSLNKKIIILHYSIGKKAHIG